MSSKRIADLVLESAMDYAIVTMDLHGNITSWSNGAENIFGWSEGEMLGKTAGTIFTLEDRANGIPEMEMRLALTNHAQSGTEPPAEEPIGNGAGYRQPVTSARR
jgi:PAS domain S-box-containing protein